MAVSIIATLMFISNSSMDNKAPNPIKSNELVEATLQPITDLNITINQSGLILDFKPGYFLTHLFREVATGERIQDLLASEAAEKVEEALRTREAISFDYNFKHAEGDIWFDARVIPVADSQFLFVARDMTKCKQNEIKIQRQVQQLALLRSIDQAIASGLDLTLLLNMLIDQVLTLMQIDAAAILLKNPKSNLLEFTSGRGFTSNSLQYTHLKLGEGYAGRVASERKMLKIHNLQENLMGFRRSPFFQNEGFVTYYGVPLLARGRVLGVLEMFHRSVLKADADWLSFLNTVAGQAAIAIDNAVMFRQLQESNFELSQAYDATIEGLMRALDLRDKETKEHTRRVSDMTVQLAIRSGVGDSELIHIRRGAILHDIGKMAIPDNILFKPGPLDDDEWKIMRRHPGIAVDLLSSVAYLAPALEIPHWHHEKWDGSGYPDRLHGDMIPFSARLFALVDVYDALTSDRPYRDAWPKDKVLDYIQNQTGRQFDPAIVPTFLQFANQYH